MAKSKAQLNAIRMNNLILRKSVDGLSTGDKVFCLRLPLEYQWKLQAMDSRDRTALMRKAIMEYIDNH